MINLILGVLAGVGVRYAEGPITEFVKGKADFDDRDLRVLAFVLLLLAASFLIWIAGADGKPILLLVGGAVGVFASALMKIGREQKDVLQTKMKERKAAAEDGIKTASEEVKETVKKAAPKKPAAKKPADKK